MNKQYYPRLDETLYTHTLPNGLRVLVVPKPGFAAKTAYYVADFGSIHREFTFEGRDHCISPGVAHYLEHKLFELPQRDVAAEFAALGASVNAFTSYDLTAYYFSTVSNFDESLELLLEFVSTPYFPAESVERERGIIDQEIDMALDDPGSQVNENLMAAMYEKHPVRVPILGDHRAIRTITPEMLALSHRAFYAPGNMVLCVVGDVDPQQVCAIARQVLGDELRPVARKKPFPPEPDTCAAAWHEAGADIATPTFCMGFKCPPQPNGAQAMRQEFIGDLAAELLCGETSALFLRLYRAGLIDSSFGCRYDLSDGCAMLTCGGDSEAPRQVCEAILEEAQRLAGTGIDEQTLQRIRRSAIGYKLRRLDSFGTTCFRLCAYTLTGADYFCFPEAYESIQPQEITDFLKLLTLQNRHSVAVLHPYKEDNQ